MLHGCLKMEWPLLYAWNYIALTFSGHLLVVGPPWFSSKYFVKVMLIQIFFEQLSRFWDYIGEKNCWGIWMHDEHSWHAIQINKNEDYNRIQIVGSIMDLCYLSYRLTTIMLSCGASWYNCLLFSKFQECQDDNNFGLMIDVGFP